MKRMVFLAVAMIAGAALAQDAAPLFPAVNLDPQGLNMTGNGSLLVENGQLVQAGTLRATVGLQYASKLAITRRLLRPDTVETDRLYAQVGAAYGITKQWDAAVYVPILLAQEIGYNGTTLGAPVFSVRMGIPEGMYDFMPVNLSLEAGIRLELGDPLQDAAALTTSSQPRPHPVLRLNAGKTFGMVNVFGELNFVENSDTTLWSVRKESRDAITDRFGTGLGVSATMVEGLSLELSGTTAYDLKDHGFSVETLAAARYTMSNWNFFLGFGPAFGDLIGTPNWRLLGGLSASFDGLTSPAAK